MQQIQKVPRSSTSGSEAPPAPHGPAPHRNGCSLGCALEVWGWEGCSRAPAALSQATVSTKNRGAVEETRNHPRPASWWIQTFLMGISHRLFPKKAKPGPLTSLQPPPGFVMRFLSSHPRRFSHQSHSSSSEHSKQQPRGVPQPPASGCLWVTAYTAMEGPRQPCCKRRLKNLQWVPNRLSTMPLLSISLHCCSARACLLSQSWTQTFRNAAAGPGAAAGLSGSHPSLSPSTQTTHPHTERAASAEGRTELLQHPRRLGRGEQQQDEPLTQQGAGTAGNAKQALRGSGVRQSFVWTS